MSTLHESYSINIHSSQDLYDLNEHAHHHKHIRIMIEHAIAITIRDNASSIETLEIIVGSGSQVIVIAENVYRSLLIRCAMASSITFVQIIGSSISINHQRLTVCLFEHAHAKICIFPLLKTNQRLECVTEQQHSSSVTSSVVRIVGYLKDSAQFGHHGMITVKPLLHDVEILQKTLLLFSGPATKAWARPCFDIASKDVHCSHGAAIGHVDQQQLWALQMRGIEMSVAQRLIIHATCMECLDEKLSSNIRNRISSMIIARL